MKILMHLLLISVVLLTGCSTINENFDCPAPKGGSCKRMDEIYDLINGSGKYTKPELSISSYVNEPGMMRIWVAPYEDLDGNYHPAKPIYSVLREELVNS